MKNIPHALLLAAIGLTAGSLQAQLTDTFEGYSVGSSIAGQGGWTTAGLDGANTSLVISTAEAFSGNQSLLISDNSTTQRPRANYNTGETLTSGTISFAVKEDQSDSGAIDHWSITFGTFGLSRSDTTLSLAYTGGGAGTSSFPKSLGLGSAGYSAVNWNEISISFDQPTGALSVSIGGSTISGLSLTNTAYNWTGTTLVIGAYANSTTGDTIYYDNVSIASVPEPSTFASLAGIAAIAFATGRRRFRAQVRAAA